MLATIPATRIVRAFRAGGSLPVLVESAAGRWVVKLRGSAHGTLALIAELVVAELCDALELPIPRRALVTLSAATPTDDRNDELADLLLRSTGPNVGFEFLEGAMDLRQDQLYRLPPERAVLVLWLDRLVENRDRTVASSNLLLQKSKVWLIDHGAALPFHHDWARVDEQTPRDDAMRHWSHLFAEHADRLADVDQWAATRLDRACLERALEIVPDEYLREVCADQSAMRTRAAYVAYLHKRLKAPRPFI